MEFKYEAQDVQMVRQPVLKKAFQSILDELESVGYDDRNRPCLKKTKFPISQILAELSDGLSVKEIAHDFSVDEHDIRILLQEMAGLCQ